jgi:hypothetical protein
MPKMIFEILDEKLKERSDRRQKLTSSSDRETQALEGIYDELTRLNTLVAAILSKMR